jgi:hypothetical protein
MVATVLAAVVVVVGAAVFGVRAWKNRVVGHLRIVDTPPGEAPEEIRRAWVGVELPLRRGEGEPQQLTTVGAVSNEGPELTTGYVVDGRAAVRALESHAPDAAEWWRQHAPHVLARRYRLCFPCRCCERIG